MNIVSNRKRHTHSESVSLRAVGRRDVVQCLGENMACHSALNLPLPTGAEPNKTPFTTFYGLFISSFKKKGNCLLLFKSLSEKYCLVPLADVET